jgi:hypothetical protein
MSKQAKVKVFCLTTDGDNQGIESVVYGTEQEARDDIASVLRDAGIARCPDGQPIESASWEEFSDAWSEAFDGMCSFEAFTVTAAVEAGMEDQLQQALDARINALLDDHGSKRGSE